VLDKRHQKLAVLGVLQDQDWEPVLKIKINLYAYVYKDIEYLEWRT